MIALTKFVHIAAIAIWSAGLLSLPTIYLQLQYVRMGLPNVAPHSDRVLRLQHVARLTYVGIASPAAFVAIASGTLLIFQRGMVAPWFSLKLALVSALVIIHTITGIALVRLFDRSRTYSSWRYVAATSSVILIAAAIITLTLAKPTLTDGFLPVALSKPGALKPIVESINPWQRP
ncbi:CopD family protein [Leptospira interrogans]